MASISVKTTNSCIPQSETKVGIETLYMRKKKLIAKSSFFLQTYFCTLFDQSTDNKKN